MTNHAERRLIFITNLSSLCVLALISTVARRFAHALRGYLDRYLTRRVFFRVSAIEFLGFSMEFHLPYFALRKGPRIPDIRGLRHCYPMIDGKGGSSADVFFYEAQISLLLVGVDEWLWTVYCCVDTFFGSERAPSNYEHNGQDAPSGGGRQTSYPVWSPRGYFLFVLSRRINQIAKEWRNIVSETNRLCQA